MREHCVSYDCAVKLKDLGFDWECNYFYTNGYANDNPEDITKVVKQHFDSPHNYNRIISADGACYSAPRLDQAAAWLREVKDVEIIVEPRFCNYKRIGYDWFVHDDSSNDYALRAPLPFSETYELALSAGIDAALELLTDKGENK